MLREYDTLISAINTGLPYYINSKLQPVAVSFAQTQKQLDIADAVRVFPGICRHNQRNFRNCIIATETRLHCLKNEYIIKADNIVSNI